jgi:hypothetical protein
VVPAGVEMELKISNQRLEEVEVEEYSEFSVVLETQWRLSERYLEKAELEWSVIGLGRLAGFEMLTRNQHLKEAEARVTIYEPFDWHSKSSKLWSVSDGSSPELKIS